jgi:uncharacterized membrane-anchored protein
MKPDTLPETEIELDAPIVLVPYKRMRVGFILAICLQFAMIASLAAPSLYTVMAGRTATLRTVPVDPWDMFRGTYVSLNYEISDIPQLDSVNQHEDVYVVLKKSGNCWVYDSAYAKRSEAKGDFVIKGNVGWKPIEKDRKMHVNYNIDRVYVQEDKGKKYEQAKHLLVDVALDDSGNAVVKNARFEP